LTKAERELNVLNGTRGNQGKPEDSETIDQSEDKTLAEFKPEIRAEFKNEAEERAFWGTHDSSKFIDWSEARQEKFTNLQPSNPGTETNNPKK